MEQRLTEECGGSPARRREPMALVDQRQGRPILELCVVRGLRWGLLMRKKGSSGELSTTALVEEKQGSAAVTHQSRQRGGDGVDKMQGGGGL
jgi:hypothetical protein